MGTEANSNASKAQPDRRSGDNPLRASGGLGSRALAGARERLRNERQSDRRSDGNVEQPDGNHIGRIVDRGSPTGGTANGTTPAPTQPVTTPSKSGSGRKGGKKGQETGAPYQPTLREVTPTASAGDFEKRVNALLPEATIFVAGIEAGLGVLVGAEEAAMEDGERAIIVSRLATVLARLPEGQGEKVFQLFDPVMLLAFAGKYTVRVYSKYAAKVQAQQEEYQRAQQSANDVSQRSATDAIQDTYGGMDNELERLGIATP